MGNENEVCKEVSIYIQIRVLDCGQAGESLSYAA